MYDNLLTFNEKFAGVNFSGGDTTKKINIPRGCKLARVLDIAVLVTTTFTQVTTPGLVQVGDGTTANAFAELSIGGTTAGNSIGGTQAGVVRKADYLAENYNSGAGLADLIVTFVAPTGGTPAGVGDVSIRMGYDQILLK